MARLWRSASRSPGRCRRAAHHVIEGGDAGLRGGAGERVPPSFLTRSVPGVWIGAVAAVAVVLALAHRALLDQRAERPALQRAIRGAGGVQGRLGLWIGRYLSWSRISFDRSIIASSSSWPRNEPSLCPLFRPRYARRPECSPSRWGSGSPPVVDLRAQLNQGRGAPTRAEDGRVAEEGRSCASVPLTQCPIHCSTILLPDSQLHHCDTMRPPTLTT
jgi:hypothetical protein